MKHPNEYKIYHYEGREYEVYYDGSMRDKATGEAIKIIPDSRDATPDEPGDNTAPVVRRNAVMLDRGHVTFHDTVVACTLVDNDQDRPNLIHIDGDLKNSVAGNLYWSFHKKCYMGVVLGELVVTDEGLASGGLKPILYADCACGGMTVIDVNTIHVNKLRDCGCGISKQTKKPKKRVCIKDGLSGHPLANTIYRLHGTCNDPTYKGYVNHGAKGYTVCDEWLNGKDHRRNFIEWACANNWNANIHRELKLTLIKGATEYGPKTCYWAADKSKLDTIGYDMVLRVAGVSLTISEWAKRNDVNPSLIKYRILQDKEPALAVYKVPNGWNIPAGCTRLEDCLRYIAETRSYMFV